MMTERYSAMSSRTPLRMKGPMEMEEDRLSMSSGDRHTKSKSSSDVAMLCKGNDGYGVAAVMQLYASNMPELHFVCLGRGAMFDWLRQHGNRVHLIEGLSNFTATSSSNTVLRLPVAMAKARRDAHRLHHLFQQLNVRIIHAHWLPQYFIAGFLRRLGYSTVWHIHGNMNPRRMFGYGAGLNHHLARWGADLLIPVSDFIAANWKGSGVASHTIHNATNGIFDRPNDPPARPFRCVIAGRLTEDKGHHLAIQAVLSLRARGHDVRLDVFGGPLEDNLYLDRLKALIQRAEDHEAIRFMGFSGDLRRHHQSYHVGVQCRLSPEPCSMWVCETLVDGLPVIAADSGGTAELIEDGITGLLFRAGDGADLASKLNRIADDPDTLVAMRKQAFHRGRRFFRTERFIEQTRLAYSSLSSGEL